MLTVNSNEVVGDSCLKSELLGIEMVYLERVVFVECCWIIDEGIDNRSEGGCGMPPWTPTLCG